MAEHLVSRMLVQNKHFDKEGRLHAEGISIPDYYAKHGKKLYNMETNNQITKFFVTYTGLVATAGVFVQPSPA